MANFLDLTTGLPALWEKIKSKFYTKAEVDAAIPTKVSSLTNDSGYLTSSTGVTGVKGSAESSYRKGNVDLTAANVYAVGLTGNETVGGNKTFSGLTTIAPDSVYNSATNSVIKANSSAIIQSSMPKYLWHDIWAFNQRQTPIYYTTTDGTTWTEQTLNSNVFIHKEAVPKIDVISSSIVGSRWLWSNSSTFGYCGGQWLVIGVAYSATIAKFNVLLESSTDEETWNTLCNSTNISANQQPIWIKTVGPGQATSIRLTITRHSDSANTTNLPIVSLRWLTPRWGNQGRGSEDEYPYQWDVNTNIYPIKNNTSSLGTSSYKWKNVYTNAVTGLSTPTSNDMAANKSYVDDTIDNTCLKKSGGQMTGKLTWANSGALPESSSLTYLLGIDAFADGGTTHWMNISNLNPLKVNGHTVNSDVPANAKFTDTTYTASSTAPKMDGTAAVGTSTAYARADHVHPTDTSRAAVADVLTKTNTTSYTPTANYHPATKKYVDDSIPENELFIVTLTFNNNTYTADKTIAQIEEAVSNNKHCIAIVRYSNGITELYHYMMGFTSSVQFAGGYKALDGYYNLYILNYASSGITRKILQLPTNLPYMSDVAISNPTNGQVLTYDSASSKWVNSTLNTGNTYTLSISNNVITLTGSDGSTSSVTLPVFGGTAADVWEGGAY